MWVLEFEPEGLCSYSPGCEAWESAQKSRRPCRGRSPSRSGYMSAFGDRPSLSMTANRPFRPEPRIMSQPRPHGLVVPHKSAACWPGVRAEGVPRPSQVVHTLHADPDRLRPRLTVFALDVAT